MDDTFLLSLFFLVMSAPFLNALVNPDLRDIIPENVTSGQC